LGSIRFTIGQEEFSVRNIGVISNGAEHRDDEGSTAQGSLAAKAREQLVCNSGGVGVHFSVIVIWRAI
jgi:hypothetical protein